MSKFNKFNEFLSNCCYEPAGEYLEFDMCPSCKEHCGWIDPDDESENPEEKMNFELAENVNE